LGGNHALLLNAEQPVQVLGWSISDGGLTDGLGISISSFSFALNPLGLDPALLSFSLRRNAMPVSGSVQLSGNQLVFTPLAPLSVAHGGSASFALEAAININNRSDLDGAALGISLNSTGIGASGTSFAAAQ